MLACVVSLLLLLAANGQSVDGIGVGQQAAQAASPATQSADEISDIKTKAAAGDASAEYELGRAYEMGKGVGQDAGQAAAWYSKAAEQGNAKAQDSLGVLYWLGEGVDKDKKAAVEWYRKSARQGDANAMFNLGAAYYNGEGVNLNDSLALAWFLLASEAGSASGEDAAKRSEQEHRQWFLSDACLTIGQMYEKGEELPRNLDLAMKWYRKAADGGNAQAQLNLAILAMNAKNYGEARTRCEAAAKDKLSGGFACLGFIYQNGMGVPQDARQAIKDYDEAARLGNRAAIHALAELCAEDNRTKEDREVAFFWLIHFVRGGDQQSIRDAQKLRSLMNDKEWKDTEKKLALRGIDARKLDAILQMASQPK